MKYYIITSSLNIDNILSSESISPASFYEKRDFGYKSFQKIDKMNIVNSIVLFSEIPYFEIRDSERENYPMVIEIDDDIQLKHDLHNTEQSHTNCQIFLYHQSIRLTPWNCRILFFSQQALVLSRLNCSDSLCNKLSDFYRFELVTPNQSLLLLDILKSSTIDNPVFSIGLVLAENKLNRLKGFLYGYYLGLTKSLSEDAAKLLGVQKKIYNIVSSIISNKNESNKRFNEELEKLENQYNDIDPHKILLRNLWNKNVLSRFSSSENKKTFESILKELSVEAEAKQSFCRKNNIVVRKLSFSTSHNYFDWSEYQRELSNYTKSIIIEDKVNRKDIDLSKEFSLSSDLSTLKLTNDNNDLCNEILSSFFFKERVITFEDLRLNRLELATEFTKGIKAFIESKKKDWDKSPEQLFFNSLRQNIANSAPFDIQEAPNVLTLSIAAFLLKGEDFEALIRYLEENGISDYRYVLGFWGAACGYVDMPKPCLNPIIKQKEIFTDVYNSINGIIVKNYTQDSFPVIDNESLSTKDYVAKEIENENVLQVENKYSEVLSEVQKKLSRKINEKQLMAINNALNSATSLESILSCLKKNNIRPTTKVYKEFDAYLSKLIRKNEVVERDLFSDSPNQNANEPNDVSFLSDVNRMNHVNHLITDNKNLKQFNTDLDWFIENHKESGIYFGKEKNNISVLERFEKYLTNKRKNNHKWLSDIYKSIPIEEIIESLKAIYK